MFQPLSNNVLVEIIDEEESKTTASGIYLPESKEKKKHNKGTVVALGSGRLSENGIRLPIEVNVGDKILFKEPWSDDKKIMEGDKELFLISEDNILGIIK